MTSWVLDSDLSCLRTPDFLTFDRSIRPDCASVLFFLQTLWKEPICAVKKGVLNCINTFVWKVNIRFSRWLGRSNNERLPNLHREMRLARLKCLRRNACVAEKQTRVEGAERDVSQVWPRVRRSSDGNLCFCDEEVMFRGVWEGKQLSDESFHLSSSN